MQILKIKKQLHPVKIDASISETACDRIKMNKPGQVSQETYGESVIYGQMNPQEIVYSFLIDDGVEGREDRKNLLNPNLESVGICTTDQHTDYKTVIYVVYRGRPGLGDEYA